MVYCAFLSHGFYEEMREGSFETLLAFCEEKWLVVSLGSVKWVEGERVFCVECPGGMFTALMLFVGFSDICFYLQL